MNKLFQEAADKELNRAISADEQANTEYCQILRRFVSSKSSSFEKKRQPDAILDADGLKDIDTAWIKLNNIEKILRVAYMKLYAASL